MSEILSTPNGRDRKSRNLRGILDYARISPVERVHIRPAHGHSAFLDVYYANGAVGYATFADPRVCANWVKSRRSWGAPVQNDCQRD